MNAHGLLTATGEEIRAAALEWNRGHEADCIDILRDGEAVIDVTVCGGGGRRLRAVIAPGLRTDRGVVHACDPIVRWLRVFDPRKGPIATARDAAKYLGVDDARVAVNYRTPRLT